MKIFLEMNFQTDGDFCFCDMNDLLKKQSSIYKDVIKKFIFNDGSDYEDINILLECEGESDLCRWAVRDLIEGLFCNGIKTTHYWVIKDLYNFLIPVKENFLWAEDDVQYYDTIEGNYTGTFIQLNIIH